MRENDVREALWEYWGYGEGGDIRDYPLLMNFPLPLYMPKVE
jgi:hypothetical protein